jgi:hypothetical protein
MPRMLKLLSACLVAVALMGSTVLAPTPVWAAKMSASEKAAQKLKTADCRKQAKEQKIGLLKRRSFMKQCMAK